MLKWATQLNPQGRIREGMFRRGARVGAEHAPDDLAHQALGQSEDVFAAGRLNGGRAHDASPLDMDGSLLIIAHKLCHANG